MTILVLFHNEGSSRSMLPSLMGRTYNKGANQVVSHLGKLIPNSTVIRHSHRNTGLQEESSVVAIGGSHEKLISTYRSCRVHLGFRVHAHLLCLALGVPSLLIVEDERGASLADNMAVRRLTSETVFIFSRYSTA